MAEEEPSLLWHTRRFRDARGKPITLLDPYTRNLLKRYDVMLSHLRCPHCGYDIRGLAPAPEDCATVCPACGCAWILGDVQPLREHSDE